MDYKTEKKGDQYIIEMTFTQDELNTAEDSCYKTDADKYTVQGFRKGKAPKSIIEKNYGAETFRRPAIDELFNKHYPQILRDNKKIRPISAPHASVKSLKEGGLSVNIIVDVEPEFTLGKYTGLEVKKTVVKVTDKEINEYLEQVVVSRARQIAADKEHKIKKGDIAVVDFVGSVDGVEFEGGAAKNHELEIGSHSFIDTFEDQLIGHKIGDKVDVNVTFPKNYHAENLAGAKALFKVDIRNILIKELPAIDDKLAKEASEFETLADFKKDIRARLEKQAEVETARMDEDELLKTIAEQTKIAIPQKMVDRQYDNMMYDLEQTLARQGANLDTYIMYLGTTREKFEEKQRASAATAAKARLVFDAIMEKEKITATPEEIVAEADRMVGDKKPKSYTAEQLDYVEQELVYSKLVKLLREKNKFVAK